ncbi:transposase [Desulfitobacterium sp. AusDCA]|uniref:transposase n=1 Tax=Desulfitobacterium sp. AusDCA TaxID=3240383 RepID=UPI003DA77AFA
MDKGQVTKICIDDFALKKRYRYGTLMVNLDTHRVIDLMESREKDDVVKWLKTYPHIQLISRDGSQTYVAAITESHPDATQVSDRFHLLKNLADALVKYINRIFPSRIEIHSTQDSENPEVQILMNTRNRNERIHAAKKMDKDGHTIAEIAFMLHSTDKTISKYLAMDENEIPESKVTVREREHLESIKKVKEKRAYVKELFEKGYSLDKISKISGFAYATVKKYLADNSANINGHYDVKMGGKLAKYENEVVELRVKGLKYKEIADILRKKGYKGTVDALRVFMSKERDHQPHENSKGGKEYISRKWMIQLIYKSVEQVKGITTKQLDAVVKEHPILGNLYHIYCQFKEILFSKKASSLESWIQEAELVQISEVNSYINGLRSDISAVKNAIIYDYSNGLAEGSVNKLKVIKRVMYG